ncbi:hypothetical protein [uncultured Blautia sp.]|uniref:hypothetical protein n=1 Tax=uncultured Blautia sp. TaxID=765821 RepID=UPI00280ADBD0|nr:hypothetical protein [uncultured Blautia sp.]
MKLRKCLMVCALASVMTVGSVSFVNAAGSRTNDLTVTGDTAQQYEITAEIEESEAYRTLAQEAPEIVDIIDGVNDGTMEMVDVITKLQDMAETIEDEEVKAALEEVIAVLEKKEFVTGFIDLIALEVAEKNGEGNYEISISVPSLTDKMENVEILHYSMDRSVWEIVEPTDVDLEKKVIEAEFEDLSPIAVICDQIEDAE